MDKGEYGVWVVGGILLVLLLLGAPSCLTDMAPITFIGFGIIFGVAYLISFLNQTSRKNEK